MEKRLRIEKPAEGFDFSYDIIWDDSYQALGAVLRRVPLNPGKICIVSDDTVAPLWLDAVTAPLKEAGYQVYSFCFPAGEQHKHLGTVQKLYEYLIQNRFERRDLLAALGGGVTGDLTGFAAATYLRGVPFIQLPTTLLAEVDSSVGGKTGVDFSAYKNMVGAFWQPRLVYMNTAVLKTLPEEQFDAGMAEVIKSALICDEAFYHWLEANAEAIYKRESSALIHMIRTCCRIKADVVMQDPNETGLRAILNFGHTIGHAVEKLSAFRLLHGPCVSIGMAAALCLIRERGLMSAEECAQIEKLLLKYHLPVRVPDGFSMDEEAVYKTLFSDKKVENGRLKFILLDRIGSARIDRSLTEEELRRAIRAVL